VIGALQARARNCGVYVHLYLHSSESRNDILFF
jgi:hypothetical protein